MQNLTSIYQTHPWHQFRISVMSACLAVVAAWIALSDVLWQAIRISVTRHSLRFVEETMDNTHYVRPVARCNGVSWLSESGLDWYCLQFFCDSLHSESLTLCDTAVSFVRMFSIHVLGTHQQEWMCVLSHVLVFLCVWVSARAQVWIAE